MIAVLLLGLLCKSIPIQGFGSTVASNSGTTSTVPDNNLAVVEAEVEDLLQKFFEQGTDDVELPDLNLDKGVFSSSKGKGTNLKSWQQVGKVQKDELPGGYLTYTANYVFDKVKVDYGAFKYSKGWFSVSGNLTAYIAPGSVYQIQLLVPPLDTAIQHFEKNECFMYISESEYTDGNIQLERLHVRDLTGGRLSTWLLPRLVPSLLPALNQAVKTSMEAGPKAFLPTLSANVCKDKPDWASGTTGTAGTTATTETTSATGTASTAGTASTTGTTATTGTTSTTSTTDSTKA